jgi:hypothetical protein
MFPRQRTRGWPGTPDAGSVTNLDLHRTVPRLCGDPSWAGQAETRSVGLSEARISPGRANRLSSGTVAVPSAGWIGRAFLFGAVPAGVIVTFVYLLARQHLLAVDFHYWYWPAGHRVLLGRSPYGVPYPLGLSYPAFTALLFAPWALLPPAAADLAFAAVALISVPVVLALLRVRDWRVYAIALLWPAVSYGWHTANLSLLLLMGIAAAWRWRDRPVVAGGLIAVVMVIKPVFAPIMLWLLATRRYRASAYATVAGTALTVGSFAVLGFDQLPAYITQTHLGLADLERRDYGIFGLVLKLGGTHPVAYAIIATLTLVAAIWCVRLGRRGCDRESLLLAIATMLAISPVVESHYFSVLLIPLALARPRLNALWLVPLVLWTTPEVWPSVWQHTLALATYTLLLTATLQALRGSVSRSTFDSEARRGRAAAA